MRFCPITLGITRRVDSKKPSSENMPDSGNQIICLHKQNYTTYVTFNILCNFEAFPRSSSDSRDVGIQDPGVRPCSSSDMAFAPCCGIQKFIYSNTIEYIHYSYFH